MAEEKQVSVLPLSKYYKCISWFVPFFFITSCTLWPSTYFSPLSIGGFWPFLPVLFSKTFILIQLEAAHFKTLLQGSTRFSIEYQILRSSWLFLKNIFTEPSVILINQLQILSTAMRMT